MIPNTAMGTQKKKTNGLVNASKRRRTDTKFIMVTFGRGDEEIFEAVKKLQKEQRLNSRAAVVREIIRKYLGYPSHLN